MHAPLSLAKRALKIRSATLLTAWALLAAAACPNLLQAQEPPATVPTTAEARLAELFTKTAQSVAELLQDEAQTAEVRLGKIVPQDASVSSGPVMRQAFARALATAGVTVKEDARHMVSGSYLFKGLADSAAGQAATIRGRVQVENADQELLANSNFTFQLQDPTMVAAVMGATTSLPTRAIPTDDAAAQQSLVQERAQALTDAILRPSAVITSGSNSPEPTIIRASLDSPYGIEILSTNVQDDTRSYQTQLPELRDGQAFVPLTKDDVYLIRIHNDSPHDAAVTIEVDGVNSFTFAAPSFKQDRSEAGIPVFSHYIVRKGIVSNIKGWFEDNDHVQEFQVVDRGRAGAARVGGRSENMGTITVRFAAAWEPGSPPADEIPGMLAGGGRGTLGTGVGQQANESVSIVHRDVGVTRALVSVRYDTP